MAVTEALMAVTEALMAVTEALMAVTEALMLSLSKHAGRAAVATLGPQTRQLDLFTRMYHSTSRRT